MIQGYVQPKKNNMSSASWLDWVQPLLVFAAMFGAAGGLCGTAAAICKWQGERCRAAEEAAAHQTAPKPPEVASKAQADEILKRLDRIETKSVAEEFDRFHADVTQVPTPLLVTVGHFQIDIAAANRHFAGGWSLLQIGVEASRFGGLPESGKEPGLRVDWSRCKLTANYANSLTVLLPDLYDPATGGWVIQNVMRFKKNTSKFQRVQSFDTGRFFVEGVHIMSDETTALVVVGFVRSGNQAQ